MANRVQQILDRIKPSQWSYVNTADNPADMASRGANVTKLATSTWFSGLLFLWQHDISDHMTVRTYDLEANDPEVKQC